MLHAFLFDFAHAKTDVSPDTKSAATLPGAEVNEDHTSASTGHVKKTGETEVLSKLQTFKRFFPGCGVISEDQQTQSEECGADVNADTTHQFLFSELQTKPCEVFHARYEHATDPCSFRSWWGDCE